MRCDFCGCKCNWQPMNFGLTKVERNFFSNLRKNCTRKYWIRSNERGKKAIGFVKTFSHLRTWRLLSNFYKNGKNSRKMAITANFDMGIKLILFLWACQSICRVRKFRKNENFNWTGTVAAISKISGNEDECICVNFHFNPKPTWFKSFKLNPWN